MVSITVSAHFYDNFFAAQAAKTINLASDTIKCALVSNSYTPNQATDEYWSTPQAYEISGTGYTTGGITLSSVTSSLVSGVWTFNAANISWTTATFSAYYAIIYDSTPGTAATDPLIGYINFGGVESPSAGTLAISWASGIGTVTAS